jgi:hypothetical protein
LFGGEREKSRHCFIPVAAFLLLRRGQAAGGIAT